MAEDDPTVRKITTRTLRDAGYTVLAACDGEEAVEMFQANRGSIALVLLDVIMPRITGHEAHRRLKELAPETKVVFCTGYDRETAMRRSAGRQHSAGAEAVHGRAALIRGARGARRAGAVPGDLTEEAGAGDQGPGLEN